MPWVKFDDACERHPKFLRAGLAADGLHKRACCHSAGHHTDGYVTAQWVGQHTYDLNKNQRNELLGALERERLLLPLRAGESVTISDRSGNEIVIGPHASDGYVIHDFLDYNPSSIEDAIRREADRKRKGIPTDSNRNPNGLHAVASRGYAPAATHPEPEPVPDVQRNSNG